MPESAFKDLKALDSSVLKGLLLPESAPFSLMPKSARTKKREFLLLMTFRKELGVVLPHLPVVKKFARIILHDEFSRIETF